MPAPGAEIRGAEAELLWLVNDDLTVGGNFSFTPNEYDQTLLISDPSRRDMPESLFPNFESLVEDIKGNQLLQVPESKLTAWGMYAVPLSGGSLVEFVGIYSWTSEVYFSPFERETEKAEAFDRLDLRANWTSADSNWTVSVFVNNVFDDIANLQVLRQGEAEFFRHTSGTTVPRLYGLEVQYSY